MRVPALRSVRARRRALARWIVLVLGATRAGRAAEPAVVDLQVLATAPDRSVVEASVEAPLARRAVALSARGAQGRLLARVVVDLRPGVNPILVTVHDGPSARVLASREVPREGSTEVAAEQVAWIVDAAVASLLASPAAAPTPAREAPAPSPVPAPSAAAPAARPAPPRVEVGAFAAAGQLAQGAGLTVGAGALAGVRAVSWPLRPGLWAEARRFAPVEEARPSVDLIVRTTSARIGTSLTWIEGDVGRADLVAHAGLDVRDASVMTTAPAWPVGPDAGRTSPIVGGGVDVRVALGPWAQLSLAALVDVDLGPPRWVSLDGANRDVLVETPRVRPLGRLGLIAAFGHPPRGPSR